MGHILSKYIYNTNVYLNRLFGLEFWRFNSIRNIHLKDNTNNLNMLKNRIKELEIEVDTYKNENENLRLRLDNYSKLNQF